MQRVYQYDDLQEVDLVVDAVYKGGPQNHAGADALNRLMQCGVGGGFRYIGSPDDLRCRFVILYTSLVDSDWPDFLDMESGQFTYYGDNKTAGHLLHDTKRKGNQILSDAFDLTHLGERERIPPFFVFTKGPVGRDVIFRGLAVPGAKSISSSDDLVAIWRTRHGQRFQNYRAIFTVLDVSEISRLWIRDLIEGNTFSINTPKPWMRWVDGGVYSPLTAPRTIEHRTKEEQLPSDTKGISIIKAIYEFFKANPYGFERCAAEIACLMDNNIIEYELTRPWMDGGRDALGKYRLGLEDNSIEVDFALEAKCYQMDSAVRIKETSRLISRLKYRQFGILVTTSFVHSQAYKEIKADRHPVIIVSARDIVTILKHAGYSTATEVETWLNSNFQ